MLASLVALVSQSALLALSLRETQLTLSMLIPASTAALVPVFARLTLHSQNRM